MIVNRATVVGILSASIIFIGGQVYANFTSSIATVGSVTIGTSGDTSNQPIITTAQIPASADTELYQYSPEKNLGSRRQLNVTSRASWNSRILVRYDIGMIPSNANIQSCQLHMYLSEVSNFGSRSHGVFHLIQHSNDWGEGEHLFSTSSPGESSWLWFSRSQEWNQIGGDIANKPTAVTDTGNVNNVWNTWDLTPDCKIGGVQSWMVQDIQEDNPGYTIRTEYQSRESFYKNEQPFLKVTYTTPNIN